MKIKYCLICLLIFLLGTDLTYSQKKITLPQTLLTGKKINLNSTSDIAQISTSLLTSSIADSALNFPSLLAHLKKITSANTKSSQWQKVICNSLKAAYSGAYSDKRQLLFLGGESLNKNSSAVYKLNLQSSNLTPLPITPDSAQKCIRVRLLDDILYVVTVISSEVGHLYRFLEETNEWQEVIILTKDPKNDKKIITDLEFDKSRNLLLFTLQVAGGSLGYGPYFGYLRPHNDTALLTWLPIAANAYSVTSNDSLLFVYLNDGRNNGIFFSKDLNQWSSSDSYILNFPFPAWDIKANNSDLYFATSFMVVKWEMATKHLFDISENIARANVHTLKFTQDTLWAGTSGVGADLYQYLQFNESAYWLPQYIDPYLTAIWDILAGQKKINFVIGQTAILEDNKLSLKGSVWYLSAARKPQIGERGETVILQQNYPNPFQVNSGTTIVFQIKERQSIKLTVFNILGQPIKTLIKNESVAPGTYQLFWNGKNKSGIPLSSGVYFLKLEGGKGQPQVKKILII